MYPIQFLYRSARTFPDRVAVEQEDESLTYAKLVVRVDALGHALQAVSGKTRPCVAVLAPNTLDMFVTVMAIHACGGVLVPLNYRNARAELDGQIGTAKPDVMVVDRDCLDLFTGTGIPTIVAGTSQDAKGLTVAGLIRSDAGKRPVWDVASNGEVNAIKFTGGSTGRPKGVLQSFRCVNTLVVNMLLTFRFDPDEAYLCAAPMTHGAGTFVLPVLATGGRVVMVRNAKPDALAATMEARGVTAIWVPPTLLYAMTEEQRARPRHLKLRHLVFGGAPSAPEKVREALETFGEILEPVYGQTEAPVMLTAMSAKEFSDPRNRASAGRVCALSHVGIMDPQGRLLPDGEMGEIVAQGDLLMNGYLDMPEETAKVMQHGWLHTGDVGYFDERGCLFIKDRIRDVVITGGFNVYPSDVEDALCRHPAVRECVVFGVADDKWGERVEAAIELRDGMAGDPAAIVQFAREQLGSVKAPKRVHLVRELPRSPVGKVLRREARAMCADPVPTTTR